MPAKKAAKKAAKKHAHHRPAHDLRRAYEHLGRIDVLEGALAGSPFSDVTMLVNSAQQQLAAGHHKDAADLLRAAEHISFAALAPKDGGDFGRVPPDLKTAIADELNHLSRRAEELWDNVETPRRGTLATLYARTLEQAHRAFVRGAYQPALELARAAEAIAHVEHWDFTTLPASRGLDRLAS